MNGSRVNVVLLAVTVVAVAFGVYGFLFGGSVTTAPVAQPDPVHVGHDEHTAAATSRTERDNPADKPAVEPKPDKPNAKTPAGQPAQPGRQDAPAPDAPSEPHGDGVIEGTVLDPMGKPMEGVPLTALRIRPHGSGRTVGYSGGRNASAADLRRAAEELRAATREAVSGKEGVFKIEGVSPEDQYTVSALDETWGTAVRSGVVAGQRTLLQFDLAPITSGTVHDESGNPLVTRYSYSWGAEFYPDQALQPSGRFVIRWTNEGMKHVRLVCDGFIPSDPMDKSFRDRRDLKIVMVRAPLLHGTVTSDSGEPVQLAQVDILAIESTGDVLPEQQDQRQTTDVLGRFMFNSLRPGKYRVTARLRGDGKTAVAEVDLREDFKLALVLDPGPMLTVRVLDAESRPVGGTSTYLRDETGDWIETTSYRTDAPGETTFCGLPDGPLQLMVSAPGYAVQWIDVDMRSGSQMLNVTLKRGGELSGRVLDGASTPVPSIHVRLRPEGSRVGHSVISADTDDKGRYSAIGLLPGTWIVELARGWEGETLVTDTVTITEGENQRDFTINDSGRIRLNVTLDGQPVADWMRLWIYSEVSDEPQEAWASSRERDRFISLEEGTYYICANSDSHASRMVQVRVGQGETEVALQLQRPNALRLGWLETGSGYSRGGAREGDLILTCNGQEVTDRASLQRIVTDASNRPEITELSVVMQRGSKQVTAKWSKALPLPYTIPGVR
ncbi:MAG: carboxypeptidase regulatory-like domain-containing protein [Planctomycetes bacterium]|nr:carboxypeptidase regulatory-like domain-containing protein [Planctomycetota bacterium]